MLIYYLNFLYFLFLNPKIILNILFLLLKTLKT